MEKILNTDDEIICGFNVSAARKQVWQAELEMVELFIKICEQNNLKYVASGGTLLGAVRHGGFIPWDDDIDLMMPRSDYEKFLEIGQELLPEGFFLQSCKTEKNYFYGHAQIRNCNTTCFIPSDYANMQRGKNLGIFIDIFPYDEIPDNLKLYKKQTKKIKLIKRLIKFKLDNRYGGFLKKFIKKVISTGYFLIHGVEKQIKKIDKLSQKYSGGRVALISFLPGYEKNVWSENLFAETTKCKFENLEINIPLHYDEVLKKEFNDYMQIPEDKGGSIHGKCFFDTKRPYTHYLNLTTREFDELFEKFVL